MASRSKAARTDKNVAKKTQQPQFQWSPKMVEHLILCLKQYKSEMDYKNVDFNSDVVAMYSRLREDMALAFDAEYFGPCDVPIQDSDIELTKEEETAFLAEVTKAKSLISKGYNRIKEKIRQIRKAYNNAVTNGTRSGSGRVVQEYYDELAQIWKGSPATEQLQFGISSNTTESTSTCTTPNRASTSSTSPSTASNTPSPEADLDTSQDTIEGTLLDGESDEENDFEQAPEPRKRPLSSTARIVDNKRKHLEKPLSAAKRDEVLLRATKEDIALKKQHMTNMQESQNALMEMAKSMSASLNTLGKNVSDGLGLLAMALNPNVMQMAHTFGNRPNNPHPPINQPGSQEFYPPNFPNQQEMHVPQQPYMGQQQISHANTSRMPAGSNDEANFMQQRFQYGQNNLPSSNGKTYEQL